RGRLLRHPGDRPVHRLRAGRLPRRVPPGGRRRGVALDQGGAARRRRQHADRARGRRAGRARVGCRSRCDLMAVLLSLMAALSYGLADFCGGMASKRASAWGVALVASATGAVLVLAATLVGGGEPTAADLWWGAAAGGSGACAPRRSTVWGERLREAARASAPPSSTADSPRGGWVWSPRSPGSAPP